VDGVTLSLSGLYVGRQVLEGDFLNAEPKLDASFILNARASFEYRALTIFVAGKNLLDNRYEQLGFFGTLTAPPPPDRYLVPAPGWSVEVGMRYRYEIPF
jgi:outer membrane receptor protein involved in Fe transport